MAPSKIRRGLGSNRRGGWPEEGKRRRRQVVVVEVAHMPRPLEWLEEEVTGIAAATIECGDPLCPNRGIVGEHGARQREKNIRRMYK